MAARTTITCQWCHTPVVLTAKTTYKKKAYHEKCAQEAADRDEFLDYICEQQLLIAPGPMVYSQRKTFMEKYGYSDKEMLAAARYIYEVVQPKYDEQWAGNIGLIPRMMEQAKEYWAKDKARKEAIENSFNVLPEPKEIFIQVPQTTIEKPKKLIDPLSILKEEV